MSSSGAPGRLPPGGTTGQVLEKHSNASYDTEWDTPSSGIPAGGTTGQVLEKNSNADFDTKWAAAPSSIPNGGATGSVLAKASAADQDVAWTAVSALCGAWIAVQGGVGFQNGWANNGGGSDAPAAYMLDAQGFVHLRGRITGGATNTVIFTLPVGFRPAHSHVVTLIAWISGSVQPSFAAVSIGSDGTITARGSMQNYLDLAGVTPFNTSE